MLQSFAALSSTVKLRNYFDDPTKLFSDLHLAKLLDTSTKPSCSICNKFKFPIEKQLRYFSCSKKFFIPYEICEKYDLFITYLLLLNNICMLYFIYENFKNFIH